MNNLYLVLFSDPLRLIIEYLKPIDLINLINAHPDFLKLISYSQFKESLLKEINIRLSELLSPLKNKWHRNESVIDSLKNCIFNMKASISGAFILNSILGINPCTRVNIFYRFLKNPNIYHHINYLIQFFLNCIYLKPPTNIRYTEKHIMTFFLKDSKIKLINDDNYINFNGYYINDLKEESLYLPNINDIIKREFTLSSGSANEYFLAKKYQSYGFKINNDHLYKSYTDQQINKIYRLKEINKETAVELLTDYYYRELDIKDTDFVYVLDGIIDLKSYEKVAYIKNAQILNETITLHHLIILDDLYVISLDNFNENTMLLIDKKLIYNT